jgi:hypothetical protein
MLFTNLNIFFETILISQKIHVFRFTSRYHCSADLSNNEILFASQNYIRMFLHLNISIDKTFMIVINYYIHV